MKKTIITGITLVLVMLVSSCGDEVKESDNTTTHETESTSIKEEVVEIEENTDDSKTVEEEIISKYKYDKDWDAFKEAVTNEDIQGMSAFAGSDEIDSEDLLMLLSTDYVLEVLKKTTYEDLTAVDQDGEIMLEFSAEETWIDEDGNEVGSAVMLYFSQGDPSLVLEYYIAAG